MHRLLQAMRSQVQAPRRSNWVTLAKRFLPLAVTILRLLMLTSPLYHSTIFRAVEFDARIRTCF